MLPLFLVLLVAQSALCLPSVQLSARGYNEVASNSLTDGAFGIIDGGETNVYMLTAQQVINDMSGSPDPTLRAIGAAQAVNLIAELATGSTGDSCDYAHFINAAVAGNGRSALGVYVNRFLKNIDIITNLANNPNGAKYTTGPTGGCSGGGRVYNLEGAWGDILDNADAYSIGLLNEQYCAARRLACSLNSRSNNVGAGITAASIGKAAQVAELSLKELLNFLNAVAGSGDTSAAGAQLKGAFQNNASRV